MKSRKNSTNIAIIILVAVLIGSFGFVLWQNFINNNTNSAATKTNTKLDPKEARSIVDSFYKQYYSESIKESPSTDALTKVVAKYGTTNFVANYKTPSQYDKVLCAQNTPTATPVSTGHKANKKGDVLLITVNETFESDGPTVEAAVINNGGPKIDGIVCTF